MAVEELRKLQNARKTVQTKEIPMNLKKSLWGFRVALIVAFLLCPAWASLEAATRYVSPAGENIHPYTNWATAARIIQKAVDAAVDGDTVLVTNGTYDVGARVVSGNDCSSRVVATNAITIRSVNGAEHTIILGASDPVTGSNGLNAVRGVYLTGGASLVGFTISNGYTASNYGNGGGLYLKESAFVSNCVICANSAQSRGGGVYCNGGGEVRHCTIANNQAKDGGGIYCSEGGEIRESMMIGNLVNESHGKGGGLYLSSGGVVSQSTISSNLLYGDYSAGGGIYCSQGGEVYESVIVGNVMSGTYARGGGVYCGDAGRIKQCIISRNRVDGSYGQGGGTYLYNEGEMSQCTVVSNAASYGGGVCESNGGMLNNSLIAANEAYHGGGGIYHHGDGQIAQCTIVLNVARRGGGLAGEGGSIRNTIVYFNEANVGANHDCVDSFFSFCCTQPDPGGEHILTEDPLFVGIDSGDYRLGSFSPCINEGDRLHVVGDIDVLGEVRIIDGHVDMGAYEYRGPWLNITTETQRVSYDVSTLVLSGTANSNVVETMWISNVANRAVATFGMSSHWTSDAIELELGENILHVYGTNELGRVTGDSVIITRETEDGGGWIRYVSPSGENAYPYTSWKTAAWVLQDAIDAAQPNDTVVVTNGVYDKGGGIVPGHSLSNRVVVTNAITIQSVNGPEHTVILGASDPLTGEHGSHAVRGAYLTSGASLNGFTVSNGSTRATGHSTYERSGGGLFLDADGMISNCLIYGNSAKGSGGGIYCQEGGVVRNSVVHWNSANGSGGGIYCQEGGAIHNSVINGNLATNDYSSAGGGVYCNGGGEVRHCTVTNNQANYGGGIYCYGNGVLSHCLIRENIAQGNWNSRGGGIYCSQGGEIRESVISGNLVNGSDGSGGGLYLSGGGVVSQSTISSNLLHGDYTDGGGIYCSQGGEIYESVIRGNLVNGNYGRGGGLYLSAGGVVSQSTISSNLVRGTYSSGGGIYCDEGGEVDQCTIHLNSAYSGGGIYCNSGGEVSHCTISNNQAQWGAGVSFYHGGVLNNSLIATNEAYSRGGGVYCNGGGEVRHCAITKNQAKYGGGVYCYEKGVLSNCVIRENIVQRKQGGGPSIGGGIYCYQGGEIRESVINGNLVKGDDGRGGGLYLSGGGMVSQSTISSNLLHGDDSAGGGIYCSQGGEIDRCTIHLNSAYSGGGVTCDNGGILNNSLIVANEAYDGGGVYFKNGGGRIGQCSIVANVAQKGGGLFEAGGCVRNTIMYFNTASNGVNYYSDPNPIYDDWIEFNACCTTPSLALGLGSGNLSGDPLFVDPEAGNYHLQSGSPCINAGNNRSVSCDQDLDGNARIINQRVDIGAYELAGMDAPWVEITTPAQTVSSQTTNFLISGMVNENVVGSIWVSNEANSAVYVLVATHPWSITIDLLPGKNGLTAYATNHMGTVAQHSLEITRAQWLDDAHATPVHYVSPVGGGIWPYTHWTTAARTIQDAVDTAMDGDQVLVADGTYDTGGAVSPGSSLFTRVVVTNAVTVQSFKGPETTKILGAPNPSSGSNGVDAVRGVYLTREARLIGFTISCGHAQPWGGGELVHDRSGGGIFLDQGGAVFNCIIHSNSAGGPDGRAGGVYCYHGGEINNSAINNNSAASRGGGVYCDDGGEVNNCTISDNSAVSHGNGLYCFYGGQINNTILYFNPASTNHFNNYCNDGEGMTYNYCCAMPALDIALGPGNMADNPLFVDREARDYHLRSDSPCINRGNNIHVAGAFDLDGYSRIQNGTVDMGAYEVNVNPFVLFHQPRVVNHSFSEVTLYFSKPIDVATFGTEDVVILGPDDRLISPTAVTNLAEEIFQVDFLTQFDEGVYRVLVGPDIHDLFGNPMNQDHDGLVGETFDDRYEGLLTIDLSGPRAMGHNRTNIQHQAVRSLSISFNESILPASLQTNLLTVVGPCGMHTAQAVTSLDAQTVLFSLSPCESDGDFAISLAPGVTDGVGHFQDQDGDGVAGEVDDDTYRFQFTQSLPDLVVSEVDGPVEAQSKQYIDVRWSVTNQGEGDTVGSWVDTLYIASNSMPEWADLGEPLASLTTFSSLSPGDSYTRMHSVELPNLEKGSWWLVLVTDRDQELDEAGGQINNMRTIASPIWITDRAIPDLCVSNVTTPDVLNMGEQATFSWVVHNIGEAATSASRWQDRIYLSVDTTLNIENDIRLEPDVDNLDFLAPDESYEQTAIASIPNTMEEGAYYVLVQTDAKNTVDEFGREHNNLGVSAMSIEVMPPPPAFLTVTSISAPTSAYLGSNPSVTWTVENTGGTTIRRGWADGTGWDDAIGLSKNRIWGDEDDYFLGSRFFVYTGMFAFWNGCPLAPGESYTLTGRPIRSFPLDGEPGEYYLIVLPDFNFGAGTFSRGASTIDRNYGITPITLKTIPPSDLSAIHINAPTNAWAGAEIQLGWTVENCGSGPTPVSSWEDAVFLSTNQHPDADDLQLGTWPHANAVETNQEYHIEAASFTIPNSIEGSFYLIVQTDWKNEVYESAETNNSITMPLSVQFRMTDLEVSSAVSVTQAIAGGSIRVEWSVNNVGSESLSNTGSDAWYLSIDAQFNAHQDTLLGRFPPPHGLGVGELYTQTNTIMLPARIEGDHYLFVVCDSEDEIYEHQDETNNVYRIEPPIIIADPAADLILRDAHSPTNAVADRFIACSWQVTNAGVIAAQAPWMDAVYLSVDTVVDAETDIALISVLQTNDLPVSGVYSSTNTFLLPNDLDGPFYLLFVTDRDAVVYEKESTTNNVYARPIKLIDYAPDLQVDNVQAPEQASAGSPLSISWRVINCGLEATTRSYWLDGVYLSRDAVLQPSSDIRVGVMERNGALQTHQTYTQEALLTLRQDLEGDYTLYVEADTWQQVDEIDHETNNITPADAMITVVGVRTDLRVVELAISETNFAGREISVEWNVKNVGFDPTSTDLWEDSIYLSEDPQLHDEDILLSTFEHQGVLAANGQYTQTRTLRFPADVEGSFYILIKTDSHFSNQVFEYDAENNNVMAAAIQVNAAPTPDLHVLSTRIPLTAWSGQTLPVEWTVENRGLAEAVPLFGQWHDSLYLSRDPYLDVQADLKLGSYAQSGVLTTGTSYTAQQSGRLPKGQTGPFYLLASADSTDHIDEGDRENNNLGVSAETVEISLPPPADLAVVEVLPPTHQVVYGEPACWGFQVANHGQLAAVGRWWDSFYLSTNATWEIGDPRVARVQQTNDVPVGADYQVELTTNTSAVLPGNYYLMVRADTFDDVRETNRLNNIGVSTGWVQVVGRELLIDQAQTNQIGVGQAIYYQIDLSVGNDLQLAISNAFPEQIELYVARERMPTRSDFDWRGEVQPDGQITARISGGLAGAYYLLLYGRTDIDQMLEYTLLATRPGLIVTHLSATEVGNTGPSTLTMDGYNLTTHTLVRLEHADGQLIVEGIVRLNHHGQLMVTFDLIDVEPGSYTLVLENPGGSIGRRPFNVTTGEGDLFARMVMPNWVRVGRPYTLTLEYGNQGDVDAFAPLIQLTPGSGAKMRFNSDEEFSTNHVQVMGLANDHRPVYILPPNSLYTLDMEYKLYANGFVPFDLRMAHAGEVTPIDWIDAGANQPQQQQSVSKDSNDMQTRSSAFQSNVQDPWANMQSQLGSVWGQYVANLGKDADRLADLGQTGYRVDDLFAFEWDIALGAGRGSIVGTLINADTGDLIPDATVIVSRANGEVQGQGVCDRNGFFVVDPLHPAAYSIVVNEYLMVDPVIVDLTETQDVVHVALAVTPGGTISGYVETLDGTPIDQLPVTLTGAVSQLSMDVWTDERGAFAFAGLPADRYTVHPFVTNAIHLILAEHEIRNNLLFIVDEQEALAARPITVPESLSKAQSLPETPEPLALSASVSFSKSVDVTVIKVDISETDEKKCSDQTSGTLSLTDDSYSPDGYTWSSSPSGLSGSGSGSTFTYNPSNSTPGTYTVTCESSGLSGCDDQCTVTIVKVDISETNEKKCSDQTSGTLSLTDDSYSPGGYTWSSSPSGLAGSGSDSTFTYNPSNSTPGTYTVTCESSDLSNCDDQCTVTIVKVDISETNEKKCSDQTSGTLSLTDDSYSPGGYTWSSSPLGLAGSGSGSMFTYNPSRSTPGTYTVTCESSDLSNCDDQCVVSIIKVDLEAEDTTTYGSGNIRKAVAGETLHLVSKEAFQTQTANITASKAGGMSFLSDEPIWTGQTSGNNGDATVQYAGTSGEGSVAAVAWGCDPVSVDVSIHKPNESTFSLIPGANKLKPVLDALNAKVAFPGGASLSAAATFSVSGSRWTVEKPNSPETTYSYKGALNLNGTLSGKVTHPTLSGEFPPDWAPGDPWALWEVYASANIGLTVEGHAKYKNEYSPADLDFSGSGSLSGTVKAGVYAVAQVAGYTGEGEAYASAGVSYTVTPAGTSPNKRLEGQWKMLPVSLNATLKLVRDRDGKIIADTQFSQNIWSGWTQTPKTVLITQPANP